MKYITGLVLCGIASFIAGLTNEPMAFLAVIIAYIAGYLISETQTP